MSDDADDESLVETGYGQRRREGRCACCGVVGVISGRGLTRTCYTRHTNARTLDRFPGRQQHKRDAVLDAWLEQCRNPPVGITVEEIARGMGMKRTALDRALVRARARGDARAVAAPWSAALGRTVTIRNGQTDQARRGDTR